VTDKYYHLIGIGGIGMSGIAQLLLRRGVKVSGSDIKTSALIEELQKQGAKIFIGHCAGNVGDADLVIYSSAIKEDNPEIIEAKSRNIPLKKRAEALAELMQEKTVIAVAGSHGKTTTTSLAAHLLLEAALMPTVAIGGIFKNINNNAWLGRGDFFVAEADESDGTFLHYRPKYAIVTNIDQEHLDYYGEFARELEAFREFISRTSPDGCVFSCRDDKNLREIMKNYPRRHLEFSLEEGADIFARAIRLDGFTSEFECVYKGKPLGKFRLGLCGRHNISNALAVIALGLELRIKPEVILRALANFRGTRRRMEVKLENSRCLLIDDYAHHPTEIQATLQAAVNLGRRTVAVFQPHRYTRTQLLLEEFGKCFQAADRVVVTDIYPASEPAIPGVDARLLSDKIKENFPDKPVEFLPKEEVCAHMLKTIQPRDLVMMLGAGDIVKISDDLAEELKKQG
jgi:UDP-N-acetylmuramate--alanine ligase